jgi:hypothetical protein
VRFDRFSQYLNTPASFGLTDLQPYPAYNFIYPDLSGSDLTDLAYFFTASFDGDESVGKYASAVVAAIKQWKLEHRQSCLYHQRGDEDSVIYDSRGTQDLRVLVLRGLHHAIASLCDHIVSFADIRQSITSINPSWCFGTQIEDAVGFLEEKGLLIVENGRILGLTVPLESATPVTSSVLEKFESMFANRRLADAADQDCVSFASGEFEVVGK